MAHSATKSCTSNIYFYALLNRYCLYDLLTINESNWYHRFYRGSDGFVFRKNIKKDNTVKVFNRNFCRSLSFKYQKDMADRNGINGYR